MENSAILKHDADILRGLPQKDSQTEAELFAAREEALERNINYILGVYDDKGKVFNNLHTHTAKDVAVREFHLACQSETAVLNIYAEDFALYAFGTINTLTGELINYLEPELLAQAKDLIKEKKNGKDSQK